MNKCLSKGNIQSSQKAHENMLNILVIREIHIKTIMRYHFTNTSVAIIKDRSIVKGTPSLWVGMY